MPSRLEEVFARGQAEGRALFVGYVTGGYPEPKDCVPVLLALEAGGTDIIELGVPFTDPLADGATVQHANHIAIEHGVTLADCLGFVREARVRGLKAPVVLMGYHNPILAYGEERLARDAREAGVDGFIVVDLPPDEGSTFLMALRANGLAFVPMIAPTTTDERIPVLAAAAESFIYCVSVTGTTGRGNVAVDALPEFLARVRRGTGGRPLAVGFGITTRAHVQAVGKLADAVVIGSAIISAIDAGAGDDPARSVREFVEDVTGH